MPAAERRLCWIAVLTFLFLMRSAVPVLGDPLPVPSGPSPLPTAQEIGQSIELSGPGFTQPTLTDPTAAHEFPHRELDRSEALQLLQGVFDPLLEASAGIFDELEIDTFLATNVAVVPSDEPTTFEKQPDPAETGSEEQPEAADSGKERLRAEFSVGPEEEEPTSPSDLGRVDHATLLSSTIPLRTEGDSGRQEPVDLTLEHAQGELRPANPLIDVRVPEDLGEGIHLPDIGAGINFPAAPEQRSPSIVDKSVAVYPNVAQDTDLMVAPTPMGVEILTQLRSSDSPHAQTFSLSLPNGSSMQEEEKGAKVLFEGEKILSVAPPVALDATGASVPVSLSVAGTSLTLTVSPEEGVAYPILVDPLFQSYEWYAKNTAAGIQYGQMEGWSEWGGGTNNGTTLGGVVSFSTNVRGTEFEPTVKYGTPGLYVADLTSAVAGGEAFWRYTVPRYFSDPPQHEGNLPQSYISKLTITDMAWKAESEALSPYVFMGLWGPNVGWLSYYSHEGLVGHSLNDMNWVYTFENKGHVPDVKTAEVGLYSNQNVNRAWTYLYAGAASLELGDDGAPGIGRISGPAQWINQTVAPIEFTASDAGLGIYAVTATAQQGSPPPSWKASRGCTGVAGSACPYTWESTTKLTVNPATLPTGVDYVNVVAEDPVGNKSAVALAQVKVDHAAPQATLGGSMLEQAKLGIKRPSYTLRVDATDGTTEAPQSGVAKMVIQVDGTTVDEVAPGCTTRNCAISREWTLESSNYSAGQHTVVAKITDAVGLTTSKTVVIELDPSPPNLAVSGTMTQQGTLGVMRPRYGLKVEASAKAGIAGAPVAPPTYGATFGTPGTGTGQFAHPAGIAIAANGNVWVVDENHYRLQKFSDAGTYLSCLGSQGSENGKFGRPTDVAIDVKENLWVTDAGNSRIQEFNEKGEWIRTIGSNGSANGQFSAPEAIAIDQKGNLWVGDTYNARLQEFNEKGEWIRTVGSRGSGPGQLIEPTGIAIGPGGNVWVADWGNNRVEEFSEAGVFIRQFGTSGTGNGQFARPDVIDVDTKGNVWVGDQNNARVQEFNQSGEYVTKFGLAGSGTGQFSFGWPMGIASDSKGNLWVADTGNNRVQRWQIPNWGPAYSNSFGTSGTGNGQFAHPADIATDLKGNLWVADENNNRLQEFSEAGVFIKVLGTSGAGNGQFTRPKSIAFTSKGNFWVADSGNNRLELFSENGGFIKAVGSYGSSNGQFSGPESIAIDGKGNIWVADTYNYRVQKLNENGEFIKVVNPIGVGAIEPTGLDVGPDGNVWVADWAHNRIVELSEAGELVRQFGSSGTGNGQFARPDTVTVDRSGNVWVGDQNNQRIQEFNQNGEYVTQFGSGGTGSGQFSFSYPLGIVVSNGNLWVTDTNNNRVQKWLLPASTQSEIRAEALVDGLVVDTGKQICAGEQCPIVREWTLNSGGYSTGPHSVLVKATDGLGNTATNTFNIEIQRDTVKPALEASGELVEAPQGWVEQESYGLAASASDNGYGVTAITFKIDGKTAASVNQACLNGGCAESLATSVNMSTYSGGAHSAELIATDGAGNVATECWTINVDPEGRISTEEATATLEAADATSESEVVAPTAQVLELEQREAGDNPGLQQSGSLVTSTGVPDTTTMTTDLGDGFVIHYPSGEQSITPVVAEGSSDIAIAEGVAGVAANTAYEVDGVVRPQYNGVQTFQALRSIESPQSFSWQVSLAEGQTLHLVDSGHAEVRYEDGQRAFLITAEAAHDATGAPVPTTFGVSGNVLTLTVAHRSGSFVYPVVAGQGWETSYEVPVIVQGPEDEFEVIQKELAREEREKAEEQAFHTRAEAEQFLSLGTVSDPDIAAPPYPPAGEASISTVRAFRVDEREVCSENGCGTWRAFIAPPIDGVKEPAFFRGYDWAEWMNGTRVAYGHDGHFLSGLLDGVTNEGVGFAGRWKVSKGEGKHLTIWSRFKAWAWVITPLIQEELANYISLKVWIWPNGFQQKVVGNYDPWVVE